MGEEGWSYRNFIAIEIVYKLTFDIYMRVLIYQNKGEFRKRDWLFLELMFCHNTYSVFSSVSPVKWMETILLSVINKFSIRLRYCVFMRMRTTDRTTYEQGITNYIVVEQNNSIIKQQNTIPGWRLLLCIHKSFR